VRRFHKSDACSNLAHYWIASSLAEHPTFDRRLEGSTASRPNNITWSRVDAHLGRRVCVVASIGLERRHMAFRAFALALEDRLSTLRRGGVELPPGGFGACSESW
jgi:hypothetical protein